MAQNARAPSPIRLGLPSDELLKLRGRGKRFILGPSEVIDGPKGEPQVLWRYVDCDIYLGKTDRWRVVKVVPIPTERNVEEPCLP